MGKPSAPKAPDYAAAAQQQGVANVNSALATNQLNQVNQVGPDGSLTYSHTANGGYTLPDGTVIPQYTATTSLSPEQQKLYDQNTQISSSLNDLALRGTSFVDQATNHPLTADQFDPLQKASTPDQFLQQRDDATNAIMARLQPMEDRDSDRLKTQLANQGLQAGSEAYDDAQKTLGQTQNDARQQALLAGNDVQNQLFNQGLASAQANNAVTGQNIQQADYFQNQPLNMLNALRSGNQVTMPSFGNVASGATIAAPPIYQAAGDQYNAAMQQYQAQMAASPVNGLISGLGSLGSAAILHSDRRLKRDIVAIGLAASGLMLYAFSYLWGKAAIGHMADEVEKLYPDAVMYDGLGYAMVDYERLA